MTVMDARHMMTPAFWQHTLPAFFIPGSKLGVIPRNVGSEMYGSAHTSTDHQLTYDIHRGEEEYFENTNMRLAQVMQHFPVVNAENDYFDRGNFFNYLYSNALRNQIRSVSSCGTNALWYVFYLRSGFCYLHIRTLNTPLLVAISIYSRSLRPFPTGDPFNFSGQTLIEDTETSHVFMHHHESSTYITKGLVHGSVKNPEDYGEAPSRWSAGAMQLLVRQPSALKLFIASLFAYVVLPVTVAVTCAHVLHPEWVMLFFWVMLAVGCSVWAIPDPRSAAQVIIRMVNTTYWITGPLTAIFWMVFVPAFILIEGHLPFMFNAEIMMVGGIIVNATQWTMTVLAKQWAKAEEIHLWRSQQAWFALWPLNFFGIPRLLNPHTSWQISTIQAKMTFMVNACEVGLLIASLISALFDVRARVATMTSAAALMIGIFTALYSLSLLLPTTSYLLNTLFYGKRHTYNVSSRHILGGFLVACLLLYVVYVPDWSIAFSHFSHLQCLHGKVKVIL